MRHAIMAPFLINKRPYRKGRHWTDSTLYTENAQWLSLRMGTGRKPAESFNRSVLCLVLDILGFPYFDPTEPWLTLLFYLHG